MQPCTLTALILFIPSKVFLCYSITIIKVIASFKTLHKKPHLNPSDFCPIVLLFCRNDKYDAFLLLVQAQRWLKWRVISCLPQTVNNFLLWCCWN